MYISESQRTIGPLRAVYPHADKLKLFSCRNRPVQGSQGLLSSLIGFISEAVIYFVRRKIKTLVRKAECLFA